MSQSKLRYASTRDMPDHALPSWAKVTSVVTIRPPIEIHLTPITVTNEGEL